MKRLIETRDLLLDKAVQADWQAMFYNVWRHEQTARYMPLSVTLQPEQAVDRMRRTIAFQASHDMYTVYNKPTREAIGFAGVELLQPGVCGEMGICLGPKYVGLGYGKQILAALLTYCREHYNAHTFVYTARVDNLPSRRLAESLGFALVQTKTMRCERDDTDYEYVVYRKALAVDKASSFC